MELPYFNVGFIGVGAMGKHMVQTLTKKTPPGTVIYLYDIDLEAVDSLCREAPENLTRCSSTGEVANKAVSEK